MMVIIGLQKLDFFSFSKFSIKKKYGLNEKIHLFFERKRQ